MVEFNSVYFEDDMRSGYSDYHKIGLEVYNITMEFLRKLFEKINSQECNILVIGCAYGYECKACRNLGFKSVFGAKICNYSSRFSSLYFWR